MLCEKFLELVGIEIGQNFITRHEGGHISLSGKLFHLFVCLAVFADINFLETIPLLAEIILRVDAPRTPLAAVQRQFHRQRGNKLTMIVSSTDMLCLRRTSQKTLLNF